MALLKPLVWKDDWIRQLPPGDTLLGTGTHVDEFTNGQGATLSIGQPVYLSGSDLVSLAQADLATRARAFGLVADETASAGATVNVISDGILDATTGQWDAVTGETGGLTPLAIYYVDPDNAGKLTKIPPSLDGDIVARVGQAKSATQMVIRVQRIIRL